MWKRLTQPRTKLSQKAIKNSAQNQPHRIDIGIFDLPTTTKSGEPCDGDIEEKEFWKLVLKQVWFISQQSSHIPGTPRPTIYKWLFQLDDEPHLYLGNGCFTKHPLKHGCLGFQVQVLSSERGAEDSLSEGNNNRDVASLMAVRHWCVRSLFANLENTGKHHLEAGRPKPSLKSSIFRPNLGNQDHKTFNGVVQKPGCYRCWSMPYIFMAFLSRPSSKDL